MNQDDPNSFYAPPLPDQNDQRYLVQKRTVWPKVLGIIGIVFGSFALIGGAFGVLAQSFTKAQFATFGLKEDFMERHYLAFQVVPILSTILGFLLLVASILLIIRKKSSRPMILAWAFLKIAFALWQGPISANAQKEMIPLQMAQLQGTQKTSLDSVGGQGMVDMVYSITVVIGVIWMMVLPIFMIIWLLRGKIRNEVAGWQDPAVIV